MFTFVSILAKAYLALSCVGYFACVPAMMGLLFLMVFATAPVVDGADAFGHVIAVTLSSACPWWPCEFAIAGVRMWRVDSISG